MQLVSKLKIITILLCSVFLVGCMSFNERGGMYDPKRSPHIYPGVVADCCIVAGRYRNDEFYPLSIPYALADLPFSFAVDTLFIPVDIHSWVVFNRNRRNETNNVPQQ
jgi:uncharacterized protein YceK